jgi:hypothetical protein
MTDNPTNRYFAHPVGMGRSVEYRMTPPYGARSRDKALKNSGCPRAITGLAKGFLPSDAFLSECKSKIQNSFLK